MSPLLFASDIELPRDPIEAMHAATKQYVDNGLATKADLLHNHVPGEITGLGTAALCDTGEDPGEVPLINSFGKIDYSLIPALSVTNTFVVGSEAEMLALTAQKGDVCVRTDLNESYILTTDDPTVLTNWTKLLSPTDAVLSVCGKVGIVTLTPDDVGAIAKTEKAAAEGVATLDIYSKVPIAQLPTQDTIADDADKVPTGAAVFAHIQETSAHGATATPSPDKIAMFDVNSRLKSAAPVDPTDVATKGYVDSVSSGKGFREEITGNGTATDFSVVHNLDNSEVDVSVYKMVSGKPIPIYVQWVPASNNHITLSFAVAPSAADVFVVKVKN